MGNIFYLECRGCNSATMQGDIKNHRIDSIGKTEIKFNGELYNLFFEFTQGEHWRYRTENKRTGKPLKHSVYETIINNGIHTNTEYERKENGFMMSYRLGAFEREMWNQHFDYTKKSVLQIVNKYKTGKKYTKVCIIDHEARNIIEKKGGFREKEILANDCVFVVGETWNDDHKTVKALSRTLNKSCEVDLITGQITG